MHEGALNVAYQERPLDGSHGRIFRHCPPVEHVPIAWQHICDEATSPSAVRGQIHSMRINCAAYLLTALVFMPVWPSVLINPIVAVGIIATKITGLYTPWLSSLAVWACCWLIVRWRKRIARERRSNDVIVLGVSSREDAYDKLLLDTEVQAIREEHWSREGAENWTRWQRFKSCVLFSYCHERNLSGLMVAYWPIVLLRVLGAWAFMREYLRVYEQTSSRAEALRASAMMHFYANARVVALGHFHLAARCLGVVGAVVAVALYYFQFV